MTNSQSSTTATNGIESLLELASDSFVLESTFFRILIDSPVYVISPDQPTDFTLPISDNQLCIHVQRWPGETGTDIIPFFASLNSLFSAVAVKADLQQLPNMVGFTRINATLKWHRTTARALFESTRGMTLILNPCGPVSMPFYPSDVSQLLQGNFGRYRRKASMRPRFPGRRFP